jgi:hypothetical protein
MSHDPLVLGVLGRTLARRLISLAFGHMLAASWVFAVGAGRQH